MVALRLVFFVLLSLALVVGTPPILEALEVVEGEDAVHRLRTRKPVGPRLARITPNPTPVVQVAPASISRPATTPSPRPVTGGGIRKVPPALGDSQSAPDDH
jgi:hypothetical protein